MADHQRNNDLSFQAGEAAGQAQLMKDHLVDTASRKASEAKEEAGGIIQQTTEQVKHMAHGAADAVKNAVGMADNSSTTTTTHTTIAKQD